jgi:hypothetical protein
VRGASEERAARSLRETRMRAVAGAWKEGSWRVMRQRRILQALGERRGRRVVGSMNFPPGYACE